MTDMSAINPTLTRVGLRAVFNASDDGLSAKITHIALGSSRYTPTGSETALKTERARISVAGGRYVDDHRIEISALLDGSSGFTVAEVGLILEDGTLLAVWSDPDTPLAAYTPGVPIALGCFLAITQLPTGSLKISGDPDLRLFFASEFAQLGAAITALVTKHLGLVGRVDVLEQLPGKMAQQAIGLESQLDQIRGLQTQIDNRMTILLALASSIVGNSHQMLATLDRVDELEKLQAKLAQQTVEMAGLQEQIMGLQAQITAA